MILEYKVKVREPYMGNQVPLTIRVILPDGQIPKVIVINQEGIYHVAELVTGISHGE